MHCICHLFGSLYNFITTNVTPPLKLYANDQCYLLLPSVFIVTVSCYIVKAVARHAILHCHMTSPIGRSALYCGLRFKFDTGRRLDPRFDYCNLVWNNYLSNVSAELLANVSVLKDFLLFTDKPEICSDMFNTVDITCFITVLCTG